MASAINEEELHRLKYILKINIFIEILLFICYYASFMSKVEHKHSNKVL